MKFKGCKVMATYISSDCCKRAGGSGSISHADLSIAMLILLQAFSLNYFIDEDTMNVEDTKSTLKIYEDKKSSSGNVVKLTLCFSPVFTTTPKALGKAFLKASLFDQVSPPSTEVFANKQHKWVDLGPTEKNA
ncbi:unnamed protein product [Penicillium salamii]|uniref:Uncharacterized protein n=1 Tax=Penicillium salamii TaxID=1612424 RepID=A0A9W4JV31_9EURO|nr:unnamed protein product [Penicillium salamii]CAG8006638.1 unnamed protein product [Penicillium salamii]CAG8252366.1 unnamed protein product [Penicillium salamii]CAG8274544.1 unnamed protein product [Penicillium salamii]CAG8310256.1 unnamed protein product [Penicillium salamii]